MTTRAEPSRRLRPVEHIKHPFLNARRQAIVSVLKENVFEPPSLVFGLARLGKVISFIGALNRIAKEDCTDEEGGETHPRIFKMTVSLVHGDSFLHQTPGLCTTAAGALRTPACFSGHAHFVVVCVS